MRTARYFVLFYFILFSNLFSKQSGVVDIRLSQSNNKERIVIDLTNKINFNAFILQNPSRLVIDLQNTSLNVKAPSFKANRFVDTLRIGKFSETDSRLVFDLNARTKIINSFYLASDKNTKNHRIVVDLEFNKKDLENEDIIGKLIEENQLYNVEPNVLNDLIDNVIAENLTAENTEKKVLKELSKKSTTQKSSSIKNEVPAYNTRRERRKPRIIIDAGHGGKDPGTIGLKGTKEKIITLIYAKAIKDGLEKTGKYKVYLTRNQDFFIELRERVSIARRYKGDLFISIHADSALNKNARGLSIYTLSQEASDKRTAQLAQKENKADILGGINLYGEYQDTINTLVDISRRQAMNNSKKFARLLENEFTNRNIKGLGKTIKYANFAVLTGADMPSILLELGFLSNRTDERMVRSFGYKTKIVNSVISSANRYFK